ncbi:MAG: N-acetylmuramoyl-L-alanine amidase [Candidatus Marinimicrobia bacterium]|nr:N-acetylmuramoyl-L-alanine amidase [Candidatus Neomarinimicrobiota bacterium]
MHTYLKTFNMLLLLATALFSQLEDQRVNILHPKPDMQFWVDRIEVAGVIPLGTEVTVFGVKTFPDEEGLFRHLIYLNPGEVLIPIREIRGEQTYFDTIRVFHRQPDHMTPDSVFINNNVPDELSIDMLYPRSGNFKGSEISLRGRTHPDAELLMNGDTLKVYKSGAFATHVQIYPGDNQFEFVANLNYAQVRDTISLSIPLAEETLRSLVEKTAKPRREFWALSGDYLQLGIRGPAGVHVYFKIPGVTGWQKMNEPKSGYYTAAYHLIDIDKELHTHVLYKMGLFSKRVRSAPLRILTDAVGGLTADEDTRVYDTPDSEQLLFPLADSVALQIIGLENQMYKIKLGQYRTAYVWADLVTLDPEYKLTTPFFLGSMRGVNEGDWAVFRIQTGKTRLPFEIKEKALPARLELKVYGAKQGWEWTTYPEGDSIIAYLERSQPEDMLWQMDIFPKQKFWGWYGRYEGEDLVIGVRKAPEIHKENPFANIRIEIDPGHGGWQRGARGITGYAEADANLRYCLKLEKLLLEAGATVFMTRRDDHQISLSDRARIAREDSVHIFVMAHNNAPGASRDIREARGASTFYTWPSAKALSDQLYPHLSNMGINTSGKVARYYYYLTRQTEYLVYLIEGAFMTNPEEEMFLLSEEGLDALAQAAFDGLEAFLLDQAEIP